MRKFLTAVLAAGFVALPVFAGTLTLQADNPQSNPEAVAKNAVVAAHITSCHAPELTSVTATAEGIVNGQRRTMPLKVIRLSEPGTFAVAREWPRTGTWAVKMIATNPEFKDFATSIVVPVSADLASFAKAERFTHAPSADEVDSVLKKATIE